LGSLKIPTRIDTDGDTGVCLCHFTRLVPHGDGVESLSVTTRFAPHGDGIIVLAELTRLIPYGDGAGSLLIQTRVTSNSEITCCGVRLNECRSSDLNITWKVLNIRC
jgi:hypothetical protein